MKIWSALYLSLLFCLTFNQTAQSAEMKIMTYNTMCKMCDLKKEYGTFDERIQAIADTILRHDPDLVGLQEIQSSRHIKRLEKLLDEKYFSFYKRHTLYPATDAIVLVKKERFDVLEESGVWLGPKSPKFNFGWKFRTPRRLHWAVVKDRQNQKTFIFSVSHFDNSQDNSGPSAKQVQEYFAEAKLPVIFAADTNITPDRQSFSWLLGDNMDDTFNLALTHEVFSNSNYSEDNLCATGLTPWPKCRIDHLLVSKNTSWIIENWGVDVYRYTGNATFSSDHRAVIATLRDK